MSIPKPGPTPVPMSKPFWSATAQGQLVVQRCQGCGTHQHYPRVVCRHCWLTELDWVTCSGDGRVWTYTVVHRPGHPAWEPEVPYVLALVELDEGPRLMTNIVNIAPAEMRVGLAVRAVFDDTADTSLVHFAPVDRPLPTP
ncbi:hypothetical protein EV191_102546 [Tamaricihabitans halophyticus]|uniref:OB-fold protein n=1 Tax=Tamaricihabitans halophyticus TaxID=1262583 RepID=A0A4R2R0T1_9PSEU|nr:Zn-ribbon domain-containing OB-fold protein [Tamaricihabitans halophyticus]TCP55334.1 hypothetical protein EV191_102546 [Tamaricihabitans halophyticus]